MQLVLGCSDNSLLNRSIVMAWKAILINSDTLKVQEISDKEEAEDVDKVHAFINKVEDESGKYIYGLFAVDKEKISAVNRLKGFLMSSLRIEKDRIATLEKALNVIELWRG